MAEKTLGDRIRAIRKGRRWRQGPNLNQTQFGEKIGVEQPTVSRWERNQDIPGDIHLGKIAGLAGIPIEVLRYGPKEGSEYQELVAVAGRIGAGAQFYPYDDHAQGDDLEMVEPPTGIDAQTVVAAEVVGDSCYPMLRNGWLVFWRREHEGVTEECIGVPCAVQVADNGPLYVKDLYYGTKPGLFTLISPNTKPIEDVKVEWAAPIIDIRPRPR